MPYDFLRGGARGLTSDLLGFPVDLATQITNLGIAGTGYLGTELGFLASPPSLISPENVPFSSDWLSKNTPLADTGSKEYSRGRFAGNILPIALGIAAKAPLPPKGQVNALLPGGRTDIIPYHAADNKALLSKSNTLLPELYAPSLAIVSDKAGLGTNFGDNLLIPRLGIFDPKTHNTVLTATDSYSPRWRQMAGRRGSEYLDQIARFLLEKGQQGSDLPVRMAAERRLADRFLPQFPLAGIKAESGGNSAAYNSLPYFKDTPKIEASPLFINPASFHDTRIAASPRFQSYKHFETSPYGADLLGAESGVDATGRAAARSSALLDDVRVAGLNAEPRDFLRLFASKKINPEEVTIKGRPATKEELLHLTDESRSILQSLKKAPSDYAELKSFQAVPLTPDYWAGVLSPNKTIQGEMQARGIRAVDLPSSKTERFSLASDLQKTAEKSPTGGRRYFPLPKIPEKIDLLAKPLSVETKEWDSVLKTLGDSSKSWMFKPINSFTELAKLIETEQPIPYQAEFMPKLFEGLSRKESIALSDVLEDYRFQGSRYSIGWNAETDLSNFRASQKDALDKIWSITHSQKTK